MAAEKEQKKQADRERLLGGDEASKILAAANWNKSAAEIADMEKAADKRSLSEILAANADAKQAEFEEKFLKNRAVSPSTHAHAAQIHPSKQ